MAGNIMLPSSSLQRFVRAVFVFASIGVILSFLVRETVDADSWWQVAIGRDIIARLSIPLTDSFSAAGFGRPYHDSHWLFQVGAAAADRWAGMRGMAILSVAIWSVTLAATYRALRRSLSLEYSCLLLVCVAAACSDRFTPRPDIVTACMIALFTLRLRRETLGSRANLVLIGVLQVVWTNSHGLFVIGPFIAGSWLVNEVTERLRGNVGAVREASQLFAVTLVATVISPFGINGWKYAILLAREAGPSASPFFKTIAELTPTFGAAARSAPDFWAFVLLIAVTVVALVSGIRSRELPVGGLLVVCGLFAAACTGRRNIPLFALAAAPFVAEQLRAVNSRVLPAPATFAAAAILLVLSWFPLSGSYYHMLSYPLRFGLRPSPVLFSEEFPGFYRKLGFKGQIYNSNYLGGYCLYHGILPLTDGRWEVYDEGNLTKILAASSDPVVWEDVTRIFDIRGVLLLHESIEAGTLVPRLLSDSRWRLIYADAAVAFWVRNDLPGLPPAVDPVVVARSLPPSPRVEQYLMAGSFLAAAGRSEPALEIFRRGIGMGEMEGKLLPRYARLLSDSGRFEEAEKTYQALYRRNGKDSVVLNELAFLAYRRGALQDAERYLRMALEINPQDPEVKANYQRVVGSRQGAGQR